MLDFVVAALEAALVQGMRMGASVSELGASVRWLGLARDDRVVSALASLRQAPQLLDAPTSPDGLAAGGQRSDLTRLTSDQSASHLTGLPRGEAESSHVTLSSPSHVTSLSVACWEAVLARRGGSQALQQQQHEHPLVPILRAASQCYNSGRCGGACGERARTCRGATADQAGACAGPCGGACARASASCARASASASCSASARPSSSTRTHARTGTVGDEDDAGRVGPRRSSAAAPSLRASCLCSLMACFSAHVHALIPSNLPSGGSGEEPSGACEEHKQPHCAAGGLGREGQGGGGARQTGKGAGGRDEEAVRCEHVMLAPRQEEEMLARWLSVCHFTEAPWLACWWLITCREAKQAHASVPTRLPPPLALFPLPLPLALPFSA